MEEFDKIIKNKLKDHFSTKGNHDWDAFNEKLEDSSTDAESEFDKVIADKLNANFTASKDKDWNSFSNTLAEQIKIKNKITTIKVCELLATIFLFLILGWGPNQDSINYLPTTRKIPSQLVTMPEMPQQTESKVNLNFELLKSLLPDDNQLNTIIQFLLHPLHFKSSTSTNEIQMEASGTDPIFAGQQSGHTILDYGLKPLESKIMEVQCTNNLLTECGIIKLPVQTKQNKIEWSIVPTAVININIVASPYDPIYKLNGYTRVSSHPAIAMLAGGRKGSNEILSGLRIKNTDYQPKAVREVFGSIQNSVSSVSLTNVSYQVIEIPLILRKHIVNNNDFKVFAGIYAGLNVISKSDYNIEYEDYSSFMPRPPVVIDGSGPQPKLEQKPFSTGWLEGGSFSENAFITGGIEIGVEKLIVNDLSLNLAVSFGKYLSNTGKGPNRDSFDDLNLSVGFRKLL
jgi:hypothetical protein